MTVDTPEERTVLETLNLLSKKWHPVIIQRLLADGPLRFNELKEQLDGISAKVLTDSLDDLVDNDLVDRQVITESPKRVEYDLTSHGRDLERVLEELSAWGERNLGEQSLPTVLIVDDDPRLLSMHASWLEDTYEVKQARNGRQALRRLDDDVDVVLLDRRMPGISGDEVLSSIRDRDRNCGVLLLTAVDPGLDVIELPFDAYLEKPVVPGELREVVSDVLSRRVYDQDRITYLSLLARQSVLRAEHTAAELDDSQEYTRLEERIEGLEAKLDDPLEEPPANSVREVLNG